MTWNRYRKWALAIAFLLLFTTVFFVRHHRRQTRLASASTALTDLRMIDAAIFQYEVEFKKQPGDKVTLSDVMRYAMPGTRVCDLRGIDPLGRPYIIDSVGTPPKLHPDTFKALSDVAPREFWVPFVSE